MIDGGACRSGGVLREGGVEADEAEAVEGAVLVAVGGGILVPEGVLEGDEIEDVCRAVAVEVPGAGHDQLDRLLAAADVEREPAGIRGPGGVEPALEPERGLLAPGVVGRDCARPRRIARRVREGAVWFATVGACHGAVGWRILRGAVSVKSIRCGGGVRMRRVRRS